VSGQVRRLFAWIGWWNPLAHAIVVAFGLDLATDLMFGNGDLNLITFVVTFVAVLAGSILLQRRRVQRILDAQPLYPGAPLDSDGTPLEMVSVGWADPDLGAREELMWARPLGDGLFRLRSVPTDADGVNRNDVVRCVEDTGNLRLADVVELSGHRTVRVAMGRSTAAEELMDELPSGLWLLRSSGDRLCIDVHPEDDFGALARRLDELAEDGALTWYEASDPARPT
jgi:Domain of unknown function (DUF4265)